MMRRTTAVWVAWPAIVLFLVFAVVNAAAREGRGEGGDRSGGGGGGRRGDEYRGSSDSRGKSFQGGSGSSHRERPSTSSREVVREVNRSGGARTGRYSDYKERDSHDDKGGHHRAYGFDRPKSCYNCHAGKAGHYDHPYGHKHKHRRHFFHGGYIYGDDTYGEYASDTPPPIEPVNIGTALSAADFASLSCAAESYQIGGVTYFLCGTTWFVRVFEAGEVFYVVVPPPPRYAN